MNPRLQKLALDWKTYVALLAAAGAAMSAFTAMAKGAADTISVFKSLPLEARWAAAAVLLVVTIVFFLAALSRRSLLLEPKRFLLSSENPEHLVGREEEVAHLARQCGRHNLVFLVGDSGTGKSSLVRAGLAHGLLAKDATLSEHDLVPLVIDLSGIAWQRGLALALARGLGKLPEDALQDLGGGDQPHPAPEQVFDWLRDRPAHAPRRLLLILDQFDDYLAVHRSQLYQGTTLRRPQEIETLSTDWHGFAELLRSGAVSALVVARSEAAGSLPALCFVEDAAIAREHLTRLQGNLVAPLLDRLSEPLEGRPVIGDPEFGWLQLRSRLLRDLEASGDGQILPIQLAVALNSLRLSRSLTPAEYERQGGLRGLERLHVERHAEKAATASGVPTKAVLEALLAMVSPDGSKTRPVSRTDFVDVLEHYGANSEAAGRPIIQLEDDRLLRRVLADGAEAETLLLYHDYLARGVREAHRQANRWTELLRERAQLFQEAVGWRQRWRALLSPAEQIRLLWERRRGGFSFNDKRRFFGLSTARWSPLVLALFLVGAGGWEAYRYEKYQIAAEVMQAIGHSGYVSEEEARQLLRLGAAGRSAAKHALLLAMRDEGTAVRASKRTDLLISLAVGLDPQGVRSRDLFSEVCQPALENDRINSSSAVFAVEMASHLHLTSSTARQVARSITARMRTELHSDDLARLGSALSSISPKLERQDVAPLAMELVERMKTETDGDVLRSLSSALGSISAKLERQDVAPLAAALVERMKTETDGNVLMSLGSALGSISAKLERQDVAPLATALVERMKTETNSIHLAFLGSTLGSISTKLERQDVAPGVAALVERMKTATDSLDLALEFLGSALGSISTKLERQDVTPLAVALVEQMKTIIGPLVLEHLCSALGSISTKLERQDVTPLAAALVERMKTEADSYSLGPLGSALGSISPKLERQDVAPLAVALVERMKTEHDSVALRSLSLALGSISPKLERQDVAPLAVALVERMKTEKETYTLADLGSALDSLSAGVQGGGSIDHLFEKLAVRSIRECNEYMVAGLAKGMVALRPGLPNPITLSIYHRPVRIEQVYLDLLKSPFVVGEARANLLEGLEQATGQKFNGDLWSFVDWATRTDAGRALKLDLEGPPPWSSAGVN